MDKKAARIRRGLRARMKIRELGAVRLVVHRTPKHLRADHRPERQPDAGCRLDARKAA